MSAAKVEPESGPRPTPSTLLLLALLLAPLAPIHKALPAIALVLASVSAIGPYRSNAQSQARLAVFVGVLSLCSLFEVPYGIWIGVLVLGLASRRWKALAPRVGWLPQGRTSGGALLLSVATIVIAAAALTLWAASVDGFSDSTQELADAAADLPILVLILGTVGFVVINAVAEEIAYRGLAYEVATTAYSVPVAIAVQGVAFGAAHIAGFPAGALGVVLAAVYGIALGVLRHMTNGLRLPVLVHIAADSTIAVLFFTIVR